MDWVLLVQATGGSLSKKKILCQHKSFKFVRGKAVLKKAKELPVKVIMIPQPDGIDVPIIDPTTSKKTLYVLTNTPGEGQDHLAMIQAKGMVWSDSLKSNKFLRPSDGWLSLIFSVNYG